jgi:hypothetical protein
MMLLISTAVLTSRFRIVKTVTNLQQVTRGLVSLCNVGEIGRKPNARAIRDLRPTDELADDFFAEDLGKPWRFFATYTGVNLAQY